MTHRIGHQKYIPDLPAQYCLEPGEVKALFPGLQVLLHQEDDDGQEDYGLLIGRKA